MSPCVWRESGKGCGAWPGLVAVDVAEGVGVTVAEVQAVDVAGMQAVDGGGAWPGLVAVDVAEGASGGRRRRVA